MKPILSKIGVFDGSKQVTFQFAAYADIDLVAFIIFDKATGYNPTAPNMIDQGIYKFGTVAPTGSGLARNFTLSANLMKNRHDPYYIVIRCRLAGTNMFSEYSDRILFYCHSEPYLASTELTLGKVKTINFPSYSFDFSYNYHIAEGEVINRYEYYLYDENKELITQSNCFYYRDSMKSFDVNGLDNHTTYYVRAKAESVGGFQLDTGFLQIYTDYTEAIGDAQITATNDKWGAQIDLYAKYYLTQSTGVNAVRFKRRKKGTAQWMTIYQESIALNRLAVKVAWTNQHINESGTVSASNSSVLSDYLSIGRINSYHFSSTDKQFGLRAYSSTKSFLGATKFYSSGSEFRASSEALTWLSGSFADKVAYYRFEVISPSGAALSTSDFNDLTVYTSDNGYVTVGFSDLYAAGRGTEYEYALSPVANGIELGYIKTTVKSSFNGAMLTDGDKTYRIVLEPKVNSLNKVRSAAVVETMSNKYPFLFSGSEANYYTGSFSGVGIRFQHTDDSFDIDGGNAFRDELSAWLTDTKAKVLKMEDGREWLIGINGNVTVSCPEHVDKGMIEFEFVEIGSIESEADMYNNGLSSYEPGGSV